MLNKLETAAMVNQRISRNTCFMMIGFRKASVDNHQLAIRLDGIFTFGSMNRNVSVDDMSVGALNTKGIKYAVADFFGIT